MLHSIIAQAGGDASFISTFANTVVKGLAIGGVYAIIALGFVIIFKATQVVNFAQGALAAAGGLFLSFLVFDRINEDVPRGQTPGTWWRAPFSGEGNFFESADWQDGRTASILLVAVVGGLVWSLLTGRTVPGWGILATGIGFLTCRWLATRSGFTWLEPPLMTLVIALVVGAAVAMWKGWRPHPVLGYGIALTLIVQLIIAALDLKWIDWFGNLGIALLFGALLGMILERVAIRPMVGQPLFSMAVITLGLEIVIRQLASDSVRILSRPILAPWTVTAGDTESSGGFELGGLFYNWSWIAILIAAALAFVGVNIFYRSKLGVAMRAVSFDQEAAMAQGINVGQVFAIAWAFGTALAVLGGVFATQPPVSQEGSVTVLTAFVAFRALPAVILGGLDSVKGALIGGLLIGLAEIFAGQYLSSFQGTLGAGYQQIVPYIVMLGVLLIRPFGLFGTPEVRRV